MGSSEAYKALAATRSHEDAKAANTLFQAAGQAVILINGGAATAILTVSASTTATLRVSPTAVAFALSSFAVGVVLGACLIAFQALSVQRYLVRWEGEALDYGPEVTGKAYRLGRVWAILARVAFLGSALFFLTGAIILSVSLGAAPPTSK